MALQPFVGPWPRFQFRNPVHSRLDSLEGGSARRKAAAYTQNSTKTEYTHTDIHASSGARTHDTSVQAGEDSSYIRQRGYRDRHSAPSPCMLFKMWISGTRITFPPYVDETSQYQLELAVVI
jgi:hypothetical protein